MRPSLPRRKIESFRPGWIANGWSGTGLDLRQSILDWFQRRIQLIGALPAKLRQRLVCRPSFRRGGPLSSCLLLRGTPPIILKVGFLHVPPPGVLHLAIL